MNIRDYQMKKRNTNAVNDIKINFVYDFSCEVIKYLRLISFFVFSVISISALFFSFK